MPDNSVRTHGTMYPSRKSRPEALVIQNPPRDKSEASTPFVSTPGTPATPPTPPAVMHKASTPRLESRPSSMTLKSRPASMSTLLNTPRAELEEEGDRASHMKNMKSLGIALKDYWLQQKHFAGYWLDFTDSISKICDRYINDEDYLAGLALYIAKKVCCSSDKEWQVFLNKHGYKSRFMLCNNTELLSAVITSLSKIDASRVSNQILLQAVNTVRDRDNKDIRRAHLKQINEALVDKVSTKVRSRYTLG